jgi:TM2 domain-containing membrane protein YozV
MSEEGLEMANSPTPHHISDVDSWGGHPDRNYMIFLVLTFLFGFIGADHFYLRSYGTACKKLLLNIGGLGIWYFWDLIQVMKDGAQIREHGLNSPFDWIRGIGRGVFEGGGKKDDTKYAAPKSYIVYTLLAVCLGFLGADRFYIGQTFQGITKLFSVFNIFLFLFGILWVLWDAGQALFATESILKDGITTPMPFSFFWKKPVEAASMFKVQPVSDEEEESSWFPFSLPELPDLSVFTALLQPTAGVAIQNAQKAVSIGTQAVGVANTLVPQVPAKISEMANTVANNGLKAVETAIKNEPVVDTIHALANTAAANRGANRQPQMGGGSPSGPGPIIAGALTALLIAGGLKGAYNVLERIQ